MSPSAGWPELRRSLAAWTDSGRRPTVWLRDDDAVEPTPALDRLLAVAGRHDIDIALAVIPEAARPSLAERLSAVPRAVVLVHGWNHASHAPQGEKKQELGPHRPRQAVLDDLSRAWKRVDDLFGRKALPVLVPPWNRIDAGLLPALPGLGYAALSVFGPERTIVPRSINTTVDIIDWHGTRGCRGADAILAEIVAQLDHGLAAERAQPVGILTHHLVHDEAAWDFLERLFEMTAAAADWVSIRRLVA